MPTEGLGVLKLKCYVSLLKMENYFTNPGLYHIAEKILLFLDQDTLLNCQCVCKFFNNFLKTNTKFWLKKCLQKSISKARL